LNRLGRRVIMSLLVFAVLIPFVPLILWSFSQRWFYPSCWPQEWGVRAWAYLFDTAGSQIVPALIQSILVAAATAAASVIIGIPAGRALGLYDFKGKDLISIVLTLPIIVPPLCVAMGLHLWFLRLGLAETFHGVVLVHLTFCLPYAIFVMWGVFSNYNKDFEDQARSLGASALKTAYGVMLPVIFPGVVVAGLFCFLLSWSQYLSTLIIGGGQVTTLPILLFALMGSGDRPVASAVSILFVVPAFVALLFSTRYLSGQGLRGIR
jgi:putative spermidine/putrescine transport system permease protein